MTLAEVGFQIPETVTTVERLQGTGLPLIPPDLSLWEGMPPNPRLIPSESR